MTTATQTDNPVVPAKQVIPAKAGIHIDPRLREGDGGKGASGISNAPAKPPSLKGLFWLWREFSPTLEWECSEAEARHRWASEVLKKPVASWNLLTQNEVNRLIKVARRQSGSSPLNDYIPEAALELWGHDWDAFLRNRMIERFQIGRLHELQPHEKAAMFEEICSRLTRARGQEIEAVKLEIMRRIREIKSQRSKGKSEKAE